MKNTFAVTIAVAVVVGAAAFYGGMLYGRSGSPSRLAQGDLSAPGGSASGGQNLRNLTPEQRQQRFQQMGISGGGPGGQRNGGGGFASGEIIAQDDKSITIKLRDGGSKIIILAGTTEIGKFTTGVVTDLKTGETVTVNGQANADGSITAQSIQLRPPMPQPSVSPQASPTPKGSE